MDAKKCMMPIILVCCGFCVVLKRFEGGNFRCVEVLMSFKAGKERKGGGSSDLKEWIRPGTMDMGV